jgi:hypothetical protein
VELRKAGGDGFKPHMTLSHFPSAESASAAQEALERDPGGLDLANLSFQCSELVVLQRVGYWDPFRIVYRLPLGSKGDAAVPLVPEDKDMRIEGMPRGRW